jgi:predicted transcriptional regulator
MTKKSHLHLGARERQIVEAVHQLGEASVAAVRAQLPDPPSYSAVRTMMGLLEQKGYLKHRREGIKYVYRTAESPEKARRSALRHLLKTFFGGAAGDAVAAILDESADEIPREEYDRLARLIDKARRERS